TDIYVRQSDDGGQSWTPRIKVNDDATTNSQFNPAIAVDQVTHFIAVTWYDCRNSPGNNTAQIYGTVSTKRGRGWEPNVQIGAGLSSGLAAGSFNFGDYDTMDYYNGTFFRSWGDNTNPSQLTPPNNSTTQMDIGTARVDVTLDGRDAFLIENDLDEVDAGSLVAAITPHTAPVLVETASNLDNAVKTPAVLALDSFFTTPAGDQPEVAAMLPPNDLPHAPAALGDPMQAHLLAEDATLTLSL